MSLVDLVFPKKCLGCGKGGTYLCDSCLQKQHLAKPSCPMCDKPSIDGMTHARCKKNLGLDGHVAIWNYGGIIRKAIVKLKYSYAKELANGLAYAAINKIESSDIAIALPKRSVLTPVPLHWYRKNYRGFNQSGLVGEKISGYLNFRFVEDLLIRNQMKKSQTELKGRERRKNVRGVFSLNKKYDIENTNIIIFDDVYTTGSTIKEACKVLKRNGAGAVWGFSIAR